MSPEAVMSESPLIAFEQFIENCEVSQHME